MTPEGKVKAKVKALFKQYGVWYCMPLGQTYGRAGVPDFLCCVRGKFVGVETKSAKGRLTPTQKLEADRIKQAGGVALVVNPDTLPAFEEMLKQWNNLET